MLKHSITRFWVHDINLAELYCYQLWCLKRVMTSYKLEMEKKKDKMMIPSAICLSMGREHSISLLPRWTLQFRPNIHMRRISWGSSSRSRSICFSSPAREPNSTFHASQMRIYQDTIIHIYQTWKKFRWVV